MAAFCIAGLLRSIYVPMYNELDDNLRATGSHGLSLSPTDLCDISFDILQLVLAELQ